MLVTFHMTLPSSIKVQGGLRVFLLVGDYFLPCTCSELYRRVYDLLGSVPVELNVPGISVNFPLYSKKYPL